MTFALALAFLLGASLLGLALRTAGRRRRAPGLPPPLLPSPATAVLLPVRDERHNVLECLEGLLAQTAAPRVRVVDDASTDGTPDLVENKAAGEPRLELIAAGPLPAGWRGKVHALWTGWQNLDSPWVLLTDADARHAPHLLARAHAAAARRRLDMVSVAGHQEARGLGESLLIPAVFALLDAQLGEWEAAAESSGAPVANGQFILLRREAWDACGGFATIRGEPLDDVAIACRLRSQGFRTGFLRSPELRVRMYRGAVEAVHGWRRNLGGLFGVVPARAAALLAAILLPPLALFAFLSGGLWLEALVLWVAGVAASMVLRSGSGHSPAYGLLYPADALLLAAVLLLGVLDRRSGRLASWKGREIRM